MADRGSLAAPVFGLRHTIDRLIGDTFSREPRDRRRVEWAPVAGVHEDDHELLLTFELPGMSASEVHITAIHGVLTIRAGKRDERPDHDQSACYHVVERRDGSFTQSFQLPSGVSNGWIDARFDRGVLTVRVPKTRFPQPDRSHVTSGAAATTAAEVKFAGE
jgi:HSP20 family protein